MYCSKGQSSFSIVVIISCLYQKRKKKKSHQLWRKPVQMIVWRHRRLDVLKWIGARRRFTRALQNFACSGRSAFVLLPLGWQHFPFALLKKCLDHFFIFSFYSYGHLHPVFRSRHEITPWQFYAMAKRIISNFKFTATNEEGFDRRKVIQTSKNSSIVMKT